MMRKSFNVYRVSSEYYDKDWLVTAVNKMKAVELVQQMTEKLGWHLSFPEDNSWPTAARDFKAERILDRCDMIVETTDI